MGGPPPVPPLLMMALRAADLTERQQKQIRDIMDSNRTSSAPLMESDALDSRADIRQAAVIGQRERLGPGATAGAAEQIQQQLDNQMVSTAIQIRGVMTPGQLSKVSAVNEKLKAIHSQIESILGPPDAPPLP